MSIIIIIIIIIIITISLLVSFFYTSVSPSDEFFFQYSSWSQQIYGLDFNSDFQFYQSLFQVFVSSVPTVIGITVIFMLHSFISFSLCGPLDRQNPLDDKFFFLLFIYLFIYLFIFVN